MTTTTMLMMVVVVLLLMMIVMVTGDCCQISAWSHRVASRRGGKVLSGYIVWGVRSKCVGVLRKCGY